MPARSAKTSLSDVSAGCSLRCLDGPFAVGSGAVATPSSADAFASARRRHVSPDQTTKLSRGRPMPRLCRNCLASTRIRRYARGKIPQALELPSPDYRPVQVRVICGLLAAAATRRCVQTCAGGIRVIPGPMIQRTACRPAGSSRAEPDLDGGFGRRHRLRLLFSETVIFAGERLGLISSGRYDLVGRARQKAGVA